MQLPAEIKVTQIDDGTKYKGHIKLGQTTFHYEATFLIPINELDVTDTPDEVEDFRQIIEIVLCVGDQRIEMENDEYEIFLIMLWNQIHNFYNSGRIRESNTGFLGEIVRSGSLPITSVELSTVSTHEFDIPEEMMAILRRPKFSSIPTA